MFVRFVYKIPVWTPEIPVWRLYNRVRTPVADMSFVNSAVVYILGL